MRSVPVAYDEASAALVPEPGVGIDVGGDLLFDRGLKELPCAFAQDVFERVRGGGELEIRSERSSFRHVAYPPPRRGLVVSMLTVT